MGKPAKPKAQRLSPEELLSQIRCYLHIVGISVTTTQGNALIFDLPPGEFIPKSGVIVGENYLIGQMAGSRYRTYQRTKGRPWKARHGHLAAASKRLPNKKSLPAINLRQAIQNVCTGIIWDRIRIAEAKFNPAAAKPVTA